MANIGQLSKRNKSFFYYLCAKILKYHDMFEDDDFFLDENEDEMNDAVERYEEMLKAHDSRYFDSEEFEYIIDHYTQHNELKRSRQAVEMAMGQHPESNTLKIKYARQLLLENDAKRAFEVMQQVVRDDDEDPDYFLTLGSCLAALGKSKEALENYFSALPYFDEDEKFELYNAIAYEYQQLKKYDLALEFYNKALPFADNIDTLYHEIRCCYLSAGRKDEAIAYFQALVDEDPYNSKAWTNIGDVYRMMGQYEDSIDPYEFALSINPDDLWTNMHLADIYYDLERYQEAIDTLEEALRNGVETSMIHTTIGDCYYRKNDLQAAEEHFRKALEINPMVGSGYAGLGYVFSDRGDSHKAIKYFEKAMQLEPWETDHLYSIAADYRKLNDFEKAMEYLRKIQEQTPNDADAYYYIADLYGEQDKVDDAINTIKFGLLQTDNDSALLYLLAYAYFVKGCHQEGLEALDHALDADFEAYHEFLEFDKELLANDLDVMELINQHKDNQTSPSETNQDKA